MAKNKEKMIKGLTEQASQKAYQKSDKYKAYRKAYKKSDKYKAYQKSDKYKASQKAYQKSDKYKAYQKAYKKSDKYKAYQKSDKYKAYQKDNFVTGSIAGKPFKVYTNGATEEMKKRLPLIKEKILNDCIKNPRKYLEELKP